MEGNRETDLSFEEQCNQDDSFVWDDNSQLYYHARSGFYHDPIAGWYYSTRDGLYYKFEDGNYILLASYDKDHQSNVERIGDSAFNEPQLQVDQGCGQNNLEIKGSTECTKEFSDNPPPSEWLEDTLIELYLSGYPSTACNAADDSLLSGEAEDKDGSMLISDGNNDPFVHGDNELNLDHNTAVDPTASVLYEEASWEEENWQAQYGQVVQPEDEVGTRFRYIDMWDWSIVRMTPKEGNAPVARIAGRLMQPSAKLHPSMPSHGGRLRTAPICKVHLDLVQVRSGQVYKLRTPSARYLASLSSYDASNPTREWGFPELSIEEMNEACESKAALHVSSQQHTSSCLDKPFVNEKHKTNVYRNRAAERRALHGSFGAAPGQKRSADDISPPSSPVSVPVETAAAEALEMSLGSGSYAQKILKNMGWKEGEGLGKTQQGLRKPLQGVGNKGTAGLGWRSR
ncbi:unnamed protein product [Amaranthus hypochondriacus]